MLYTNNIRERRDPYIFYEQNSIEDTSNDPNWHDEDLSQNVEYHMDYQQSELESLRDKRQIDVTPLDQDSKTYEMFLTPLYAITAVFAVIFIIGPFLVKKGPNRGIVQASIMLTAFCMWIFWFTIYFGQMNPLMGPRLENTTVVWIAYKLGNPFDREQEPGPGPAPAPVPEPEPEPAP